MTCLYQTEEREKGSKAEISAKCLPKYVKAQKVFENLNTVQWLSYM
jgi:hypothetical protein